MSSKKASEWDALLDDRRDDERWHESPRRRSLRSLVLKYWPLGWTAFGGPISHVAIFHQHFVDTPGEFQVSDDTFVELFSLAQALPGPGSTELIAALGLLSGGWLGGVLAFLLFQLPGCMFTTVLGLILGGSARGGGAGAVGASSSAILLSLSLLTHGLVAAAFAQVAIAACAITLRVTNGDTLRRLITMLVTLLAVLSTPRAARWIYPSVLLAGGLTTYLRGRLEPRGEEEEEEEEEEEDDDDDVRDAEDGGEERFGGGVGAAWRGERRAKRSSRRASVAILAALVAASLAIIVPVTVLGERAPLTYSMLDVFWRMGIFVFGGGQVALPILLSEVVERGWLSEEVFLAGFALVHVLPGPLFNIAPFVGAAMLGVSGALLGFLAAFLPGVALVFAVVPVWDELRHNAGVNAALSGVTAAAGGLINAAVYMLLFRAISSAASFAIAVLCAMLTLFFRWSAPVSIILGGLVGLVFILLDIGGPFCTVSWWTNSVEPEVLAKLCPT